MMDAQSLAFSFAIFTLLQGISRLLRPSLVRSLFKELPKNRSLTYVVGTVLTLVASLLVVPNTSFHTWQASCVTLIIWGMLLDGCIYLLGTEKGLKQYLHLLMQPGIYYGIAIGYLLLGTLLCISVAVS